MSINKYLKDIKVEEFPKVDASSSKKFAENMGKEFTVNDFQEAEKNLSNMSLYNEIVDKIVEEQIKIMNQVICGSFKDCLGCKSGEDVYIILTSVSYLHKYNQIVDSINEQLKSSMMGFGPDCLVPQIRKLSEPLKESDELKHKLIKTWEEVYGNSSD